MWAMLGFQWPRSEVAGFHWPISESCLAAWASQVACETGLERSMFGGVPRVLGQFLARIANVRQDHLGDGPILGLVNRLREPRFQQMHRVSGSSGLFGRMAGVLGHLAILIGRMWRDG